MGEAVPVAERAARRTDGEEESGEAWNEKERRCVVEARGRVEKAHGRIEKTRRRIEKQRARNRKTRKRRIKVSGPKFERVRGSKSESARARIQKACNLPTTL